MPINKLSLSRNRQSGSKPRSSSLTSSKYNWITSLSMSYLLSPSPALFFNCNQLIHRQNV